MRLWPNRQRSGVYNRLCAGRHPASSNNLFRAVASRDANYMSMQGGLYAVQLWCVSCARRLALRSSQGTVQHSVGCQVGCSST